MLLSKALKCKFPAFLGNDQPTDHPNKQQTDFRVHGEVTPPIKNRIGVPKFCINILILHIDECLINHQPNEDQNESNNKWDNCEGDMIKALSKQVATFTDLLFPSVS